jgi:hypothetical protein
MKTSELVGPALDWAVAKCEGLVNGIVVMLDLSEMASLLPQSTGRKVGRSLNGKGLQPGLSITRTRMLVCRAGLLPNIVSVSTQGQPL